MQQSTPADPTPADPTPADPARPRQPWLHELQVAVHGNVTCLSARDATVGEPGTGLYVDDRRVLSHLALLVDGRPPVPVAAASVGERTEVLTSCRHLGAPGPDPTVELRVVRVLRDGGLTDVLSLRTRAGEAVRTRLEIRLGGDGASIGQVKAGTDPRVLLPASKPEDGLLAWHDERHRTRVRSDVAPTVVTPGDPQRPSLLAYDVAVIPGHPVEVRLEVDVERLVASAFDADPGADALDWSAVRVEGGDPRLAPVLVTSLTDLRQLAMRDPLAPGDVFVGAGSPWYLTLFGRDALWAARLVLPLGTTLAGGTLRALARRQGRVDDPATAEQPGRIPHEVRREPLVDEVTGLHLPTTYYGTVDATALWVCLLHDAWRHGLPQDEVVALLPALRAALVWLRRSLAQSPDGLLRYVEETGTGLANQGWKDSDDAMRRADGSVAPAPIALLEAQGYTVEALLGAADLLDHLAAGEQDPDLAPAMLRDLARTLAERVRRAYWVEGDRGTHLAMAIDGRGRPVDGAGSSTGHVLGTGLLTPQEEARVVERLVAPDLLGPFGIGTLSRDNPGYNPLGYHTGSVWAHDTAICLLGVLRSGHGRHGGRIARALLASSDQTGGRWAELCSGDPVLGRVVPYPASCRPQAWSAATAGVLLTVALGLQVDVPGRRLTVAPPRPLPLGEVSVSGVRVGDARVTVHVSDHEPTRVEGLPPGWTLVAPGP